jgi:hypothetical protein
VIYGCLTEQATHQTVRISGSSPYFDEVRNKPVSGATVSISSSDNRTFELTESPDEQGFYLTVRPMAAVPGVTYTLCVEVDFDGDGVVETYTASTVMTHPAGVDSIAIRPISIMGYKHYTLSFFAPDAPSTDYYLARFVINDTIETRRISDLTVFSDEGFNGQYFNDVALRYFDDTDNDFPSGSNMETDTAFSVRPGYRITLLFSRIDQGYFNFINQCREEKRGENPFFGGPPSNIETNIDNGGAGYFAAFSTTATEAVVPDAENE